MCQRSFHAQTLASRGANDYHLYGKVKGPWRMFGFFKNKIDKDAQAAIERRARQIAPDKAPPLPPGTKAPAQSGPSREQAIADMQAKAKHVMTPERQALIQNALKVHRAKQQILADLDDESRAKLVAMAITTLLRQDGPDDKSKK